VAFFGFWGFVSGRGFFHKYVFFVLGGVGVRVWGLGLGMRV